MAYNQRQVIEAIKDSKGMVYVAAKAIGCNPVTIYNLAKKIPAIQEAIDIARGEMTDKAESKLFEAVDRGESWAVCFYLKTQGKNRGYIERQELSGPDGNQLVITVRHMTHAPSE
jgi:hypothetical protein